MSSKEDPINFSLHRITTEQFAAIPNIYKEKLPSTVTTEFKVGVDKNSRLIAVFMTFKFECDKTLFIILEAACHFKIEQKSWDKFHESKNPKAPIGFMRHLAMITTGTARGILHSKTENTEFNKFVIPLINVETIIKDSVPLE